MTNVAVRDIVPNPFRDFKLFPLDKEQISKLKQSVTDHGFWGGVKARRTDDGVEIAMGHHRIEAAREAGLKHVDILVEDMDDDEMIRLMCMENATQRGAVAAAVLNEVAAATRRLAKALLQKSDSEIPESLDWTDASVEKARIHLENGKGVGEPIIRQYLRDARSAEQIKQAVSSLKDTGLYTKIISEVEKELKEEAEEAEEEAKEEEKKQSEKAPAARKKATVKKQAKERSSKASTKAKEKHKRIYDERCASVFDNDYQHAAFKSAVTSESGQRFIAVSQQYDLAKEIHKTIGSRKGQVGAPFIKDYVANVIKEAINKQRNIDKEEKERLERENRRGALKARAESLLQHLRTAGKDADKIREMLEDDPELNNTPVLRTLADKIDTVISLLQSMSDALGR